MILDDSLRKPTALYGGFSGLFAEESLSRDKGRSGVVGRKRTAARMNTGGRVLAWGEGKKQDL